MYQYILFDLDGTISDSGLGITNSVMYALKKFGIEIEDRSTLYRFIGPPLLESFQRFCGFTEEQSKLGIQYQREYYTDKGLYENEVYEGIEELFVELKKMGKSLIVATSKPEPFAKRILAHFKLDSYFDYIAGATLDGSRITKVDVIKYALETCGITDPKQAVMVGDREHDALGAAAVGMDSIGVLYGFGSREELEAAGATYIADGVMDVLEIV